MKSKLLENGDSKLIPENQEDHELLGKLFPLGDDNSKVLPPGFPIKSLQNERIKVTESMWRNGKYRHIHVRRIA